MDLNGRFWCFSTTFEPVSTVFTGKLLLRFVLHMWCFIWCFMSDLSQGVKLVGFVSHSWDIFAIFNKSLFEKWKVVLMSLFLAFLCLDKVDIYSGSSSSAEYDGRWSPHSGCLWIDDWWKLYFHVPQWVRVGLVWARRMCPGCQGYGQHLPRPPVHPLLHGVFPSVSLLCRYLSEEVLFYLITMYNSVFCFFFFSVWLQTVLQLMQNGEHGQRPFNLVPAALVGRWQL